MSLSVNGLGKLMADVDLNYTQSGTAVAKVNIAINHDRKKQGEKYPESDYYRLNVWGKQAEFFQNNFSKGSRIYFTGGLELSKYTTQNGEERESKDIQVDKFKVIDWENTSSDSSPISAGQEVDIVDDDLPF